jgi:hypothetical protein
MAALDPEIELRVQEFWYQELVRMGGEPISRRKLHENYQKKYGKDWRGKADIGLSKFNALVRELEKGEHKLFPRTAWQPWRNDEEGPETAAHLLTMDAVCQVLQGRRLFQHEADWAARLRVAIRGLAPYDQFCFVTLYAHEQELAYFSKREISTSALDALLVYKPWSPENTYAYRLFLLARPDAYNAYLLGGQDPRWISWRGTNLDGVLPWHLPIRDRPRYPDNPLPYQAEDAALSGWMGSNPIFFPPYGFGSYGPPDLTMPPVNKIVYTPPSGEVINTIEIENPSSNRRRISDEWLNS